MVSLGPQKGIRERIPVVVGQIQYPEEPEFIAAGSSIGHDRDAQMEPKPPILPMVMPPELDFDGPAQMHQIAQWSSKAGHACHQSQAIGP